MRRSDICILCEMSTRSIFRLKNNIFDIKKSFHDSDRGEESSKKIDSSYCLIGVFVFFFLSFRLQFAKLIISISKYLKKIFI